MLENIELKMNEIKNTCKKPVIKNGLLEYWNVGVLVTRQ